MTTFKKIQARFPWKSAARRPRSARPQLEALERREVLSAIPTLKSAIQIGAVDSRWKYSRNDAIDLSVSTTGSNGKPLNWGQYVLAKSKDVDVYRFSVNAGTKVRFEVKTWEVSTTWVNPATHKPETKGHEAHVRLALFDSAGTPVNSDGGPRFVSEPLPRSPHNYQLEYTFRRSGVYYLAISHSRNSTFHLVDDPKAHAKAGDNSGPPNGTGAFGPYRLDAQAVR